MKSVFREKVLKLFPVPQFLEMPAIGLDVSDFTIKFIEFVHGSRGGLRVGRHDSRKIAPGTVVAGEIKQPQELSKALREVRDEYGLRFVRALLPEEKGYLFETRVPDVDPKEIRSSVAFKLEENVPLKPDEVVFDYDVVGSERHKRSTDMLRVVVSAFAEKDLASYVELFEKAGLQLLSLEIEAQAIARAVVPKGDMGTYMLVDFGRARSGISIVSGGVLHYTTTVDVGGEVISETYRKVRKQNAPSPEVAEFKNRVGLSHTPPDDPMYSIMAEVVNKLKEEMDRHVLYWETHGAEGDDGGGPIKKVLLCGGNSNLAGLRGYLSTQLRIPVERANVWTNAFSVEKQIPEIDYNGSLSFAPAIGLALHR